MINKRLLSIDVLRGYAIATILVIHRIHYQWTGMQTREVLRANIHGPWAPLIVLTIVMFTMAGIFYFISGLVNSYSIYNRVSKDSCGRSKWMWGGILSGVLFIIFNYLHRLFFMNGFIGLPGGKEPEFPIGLLTGMVRDSSGVVFRWSQVTEPGTLSLIGFVLIIITLVLGIVYRKGIPGNSRKVYNLLSVLAVFFLLITPFFKFWLRPVYESAYAGGHYGTALCLGHVCQEFCLFPYLGYGFFGAIVGISLASKENKKLFFRRNWIWTGLLLAAGIAGILLFDREDPLGKRIIGASVSYIELAIFILMINLLLKSLDFSQGTKQEIRWSKTLGIRRMGMVALTVYFFEPFVAEVLSKITNYVCGTSAWTGQFYWVLLFGFSCLAIWWIIIRYWSRINFAGSLEWIIAFIILRLAGKRSTKIDFQSVKPITNQSQTPDLQTVKDLRG